MKHWLRLTCVVLFLVGIAISASACPVCYGANDSPMAAGMNTAILVMLGIIGFVLSMIVTFFLMILRRYKRQQSSLSNQTFIDERGNLKMKKEKGVVEWNNY